MSVDKFIVHTVMGDMTNAELASLMEALSYKDFFTVNEAVVFFGIGRTRLRKLMKSEDCDFVVLSGKHSRIVREKLHAYILAGKAGDLKNVIG